MDPTDRARSPLFRRLSRAAFAAAFVIPVVHLGACGGKVVVDGLDDTGDGGGGAGGGTSTSTTTPTGGMSGSTGSSGCALTTTGATTGTGLMHYQVTECFPPPSGTKCPSQLQATQYILPSTPCSVVSSVDCGPVKSNDQCCYIVTEEVVGCGG